jgi:hypothetical protein
MQMLATIRHMDNSIPNTWIGVMPVPSLWKLLLKCKIGHVLSCIVASQVKPTLEVMYDPEEL